MSTNSISQNPQNINLTVQIDPEITPVSGAGEAVMTYEQACSMVLAFFACALDGLCGELVNLRDGSAKHSTFKAQGIFGFFLTSSLMLIFEEKVIVDDQGRGHGLLEPSRDPEMIARMGLDLDPKTLFWWCNVRPKTATSSRDIVGFVEPRKAKYIMLFARCKPSVGAPVLDWHLDAEDIDRNAHLILVPVGFTNSQYLEGVDETTLSPEEYMELNGEKYVQRHQKALEKEREVWQHKRMGVGDRLRMLEDLQRTLSDVPGSLYLTPDEKESLSIANIKRDTGAFDFGGRPFRFSNKRIEQVSLKVREVLQKAQRRKKECLIAESFMRVAKRFPIRMNVKLYSDVSRVMRDDIKGYWRSGLILYVYKDRAVLYCREEKINAVKFGAFDAEARESELDLDLATWKVIAEAYRSTRPRLKRVWDYFFLKLKCPVEEV